jgi:hypothetical protein
MAPKGGMLIVGLLFLLWWRLRPLPPPVDPARDDDAASSQSRYAS